MSFSAFYRRCMANVVLLCLGLSISALQSRAAIITEGDAEFDGDISVAYNNGDGSLTITAPTVLQGGGIFVADQPGLVGSVVVDGGTYEGTSEFEIGRSGDGSLEVRNGGKVTNDSGANLSVASTSGSSGSVLVSGVGSLLDMPFGRAEIGQAGLGTFTVEDGAHATHGDVFVGGGDSRSIGIGTTTVTGNGSRWNINDNMTIGPVGSGELWIQDGGQVHSAYDRDSGAGIVGSGNGSGLLVLEGQGSLWQHHGNLGVVIGDGGDGTVAVRSGGKVISPGLTVGGRMFSSVPGNGLVTIDGLGSQWSTSGLSVGDSGSGQILLTGGGKLTNNSRFGGGSTTIGNQLGSYGRLLVDGTTTQWLDNSNELSIGVQGFGELEIQNGAVMNSSRVTLGQASQGHGEARIEGSGTKWAVQGLTIGEQGSARVEIRDGAALSLSLFGGGEFQIGPQGEVHLADGTILVFNQTFLTNEGTLGGAGQIQAPVLNFGGSIRLNPADRLVITDRLTSFDQSRVDILGGELEVEDEFHNEVDSVVTMENATLRTSSSLDNDGTVAVAFGTNRVYGDVNNQGGIVLSGNSQTTFYDDVQNSDTINVSSGSTATFFGEISGNGVGGSGTVFLEGDITPGFSPAVMAFGGDVNLGDFSSLTLEIAGDNPGTDHDQLHVAGQASLGGELILDVQSPLGDVALSILEADSIVGTFDAAPPLFSHVGAGMFLTDITYGLNQVTISLVEGFADFNLDGSVDAVDLGIWQTNYGTTSGAGLAEGDSNGDGRVDGPDFLTWQRRFNPQIPEVLSSLAVPEPTGLVLSVMSLGWIAIRRRTVVNRN